MKFLLIDFGASRVKAVVYDKDTGTFSDPYDLQSPFIQSTTISVDKLTSLLQDLVSCYTNVDGIVICTILGGTWIEDIYYSWKSSTGLPKGAHCLISKVFKSDVHEDHKPFTNNENYLPGLTEIGRIQNIPVYSSLGDTNCALRSVDIPEDGVVINIGTGSQVVSRSGVERYFPAGRSFLVFQQLFSSMGLDLFSFMDQVTVDDVVSSTLQVDLANFPQARGFIDGGSISLILEESFTVRNLLGSLLKTFVTQYKDAVGEANTILLMGGVSNKIKILQQLFEYYYPNINIVLQYTPSSGVEATHLGMARYITQSL
jgi:hypothetical protein